MQSSREFRVNYSEVTSGGGICAGEEDSAYPAREDELIHVTFSAAAVAAKDYSHDMNWGIVHGHDKPLPMDHRGAIVYLVVARFDDGDTFGRTIGRWEVEAAFPTESQASAWKIENLSRLAKKHDDYFGGFARAEIVRVPFGNLCAKENDDGK